MAQEKKKSTKGVVRRDGVLTAWKWRPGTACFNAQDGDRREVLGARDVLKTFVQTIAGCRSVV